MKILVTGGAGFIGSHVVEAYAQAGHQVVVIDNLKNGQKQNIPPGIELVEKDILSSDLDHLIAIFQPKVINHHAAQVSVTQSTVNPFEDAQVNILGTIRLLELAKKHSVKKFIFASSGGAIFGSQKPPFSETSQPSPVSPYGIAKLTAEKYINYFSGQGFFHSIILRYANVYGPRQNITGEAGVVSLFINKLLRNEQPIIYGNGQQTRDYIYVKDVAKANVLSLGIEKDATFHIGTGIQTSTTQLFDLIQKELNMNKSAIFASARVGEVEHSSLSNDLAETELDWEPSVSLQQGIKETINWYRSQQ